MHDGETASSSACFARSLRRLLTPGATLSPSSAGVACQGMGKKPPVRFAKHTWRRGSLDDYWPRLRPFVWSRNHQPKYASHTSFSPVPYPVLAYFWSLGCMHAAASPASQRGWGRIERLELLVTYMILCYMVELVYKRPQIEYGWTAKPKTRAASRSKLIYNSKTVII